MTGVDKTDNDQSDKDKTDADDSSPSYFLIFGSVMLVTIMLISAEFIYEYYKKYNVDTKYETSYVSSIPKA